jgi:hypothetical protein
VFQNPEFFGTQVSLSPEQSTLDQTSLKVPKMNLRPVFFKVIIFKSINYLSSGQSQTFSSIDLLGTNLMYAVVCGTKNGTQIRAKV